LSCAIIAGAANNQLKDENVHGQMCKDKGILYAPDFLINAGGLINVYTEWIGYNRDLAMANTEKIYEVTTEIIKKAHKEDIPTYLAANRMAEERIEAIGKVQLTY
jgi:leucine dehydrogenase